MVIQISSFTLPYSEQAVFAMRTKFNRLPHSLPRYQVSKRLSDNHKDASNYGETEQDGCTLNVPVFLSPRSTREAASPNGELRHPCKLLGITA